jgi:hypothetical protein
MKEFDLMGFVKGKVIGPIDLEQLPEHNQNVAKVKRMVFDLVKDHSMPYIVENKLVKDMFDALVTLY